MIIIPGESQLIILEPQEKSCKSDSRTCPSLATTVMSNETDRKYTVSPFYALKNLLEKKTCTAKMSEYTINLEWPSVDDNVFPQDLESEGRKQRGRLCRHS